MQRLMNDSKRKVKTEQAKKPTTPTLVPVPETYSNLKDMQKKSVR